MSNTKSAGNAPTMIADTTVSTNWVDHTKNTKLKWEYVDANISNADRRCFLLSVGSPANRHHANQPNARLSTNVTTPRCRNSG